MPRDSLVFFWPRENLSMLLHTVLFFYSVTLTQTCCEIGDHDERFTLCDNIASFCFHSSELESAFVFVLQLIESEPCQQIYKFDKMGQGVSSPSARCLPKPSDGKFLSELKERGVCYISALDDNYMWNVTLPEGHRMLEFDIFLLRIFVRLGILGRKNSKDLLVWHNGGGCVSG